MRPPASDLLAAIGGSDTAAVREILVPFVVYSPEWQGEAERSFIVQRITDFIIDGIAMTGLDVCGMGGEIAQEAGTSTAA